MSQITLGTSAFKFSQISAKDVDKGTALFIQANLGALLRKEKSVIVGLVAELCKHISESDYIDFTPPSVISTKPHLGDLERYPEEKLMELAEGTRPFDADYVSIGVAGSEIAFRNLQTFVP